MTNKRAYISLSKAVTYLKSKGIDNTQIYKFIEALTLGKSIDEALKLSNITLD